MVAHARISNNNAPSPLLCARALQVPSLMVAHARISLLLAWALLLLAKHWPGAKTYESSELTIICLSAPGRPYSHSYFVFGINHTMSAVPCVRQPHCSISSHWWWQLTRESAFAFRPGATAPGRTCTTIYIFLELTNFAVPCLREPLRYHPHCSLQSVIDGGSRGNQLLLLFAHAPR